MLTQEKLKKLVSYNPATGIMVARVSRATVKEGSVLGYNKSGYLSVKINGVAYQLHRLAFLYMEGAFPKTYEDVDHINGNKIDNRFANLRRASRAQNAYNAKLNAGNELEVKNVRQLKDTGKYQVRIKQKSYGCFEDLEFAELVATEVRESLFGEFARNE